MRYIDENPLFRRVIIPWYDSDPACVLLIGFMGLVFGFALIGLSVVRETPAYHGYVGVPLALLLLSGYLIISVTFRLIRRHTAPPKYDADGPADRSFP